MILAEYTLPLEVPQQEIAYSITGSGGRCPTCGKQRMEFVKPRIESTVFDLRAGQYLRPRPAKPLTKVRVEYRIYTEQTAGKSDLKLYATLDRMLVANGILKNDTASTIISRDGSAIIKSKEARVEIKIYKEEKNAIV